ncbi:hypothetical protein BDV95DRAFT_576230 [Massariosphaeria phaeospora]|uniref:Carbohydrate-binding module family 19 domain-containing protein n=1 Tax=Massariosphaeria phaeospora TaxID=100035 RepID=A0A7C8MCF3_9PLEO|nr:hypothetical protein BDV95DRAFT_576230 [Massariosphaeria phaeospora]
MYMNCAPITVSGGTDDSAAFDGLPDMETANIGGDCKTSEGSDYTFKNPGKYSTRIGSGPFIPLCGGAPSSGTPPPPGGPQAPAGSQAPAVSTPAPAGSTPAPSAPAGSTPAPSAPAGSQPGLVTSTIRTMVTVTASFGQPTPAPSAPVAAPSGSAPAPSGAAPPASTGVPAVGGGGTCTTDGALICNGETEFGICNHGKVTFQPVAAGTKCQDGKIAKRDFKRDYTHRAQRTAF